MKNNIFNSLQKHRFLFEELVKRDFKKKYKKTTLGVAWSILAPLLQLLVMALVFTQFFGRTTPHFIIYLFCGNIIFSYYNESTTVGMSSILTNAGIFTKVNVPKYLFMLSRNIQTLINFLLILVVLFVFIAIEGLPFTWKFFLLLYPIAFLVVFNIGVGMILSTFYVFFRDLEYLYRIFTMLLMYLSAIFYNVSVYSESIQQLFLLNPIYVFITYFRQIIIDGVVPNITMHGLIALYSVIVIVLGSALYKKYNEKFLYYV